MATPLANTWKLGKIIVHVEDVVYFLTRNHEGVTFSQRIDVEESIEFVAFCTLVAGDFASGDFAEDGHVVYDFNHK